MIFIFILIFGALVIFFQLSLLLDGVDMTCNFKGVSSSEMIITTYSDVKTNIFEFVQAALLYSFAIKKALIYH